MCGVAQALEQEREHDPTHMVHMRWCHLGWDCVCYGCSCCLGRPFRSAFESVAGFAEATERMWARRADFVVRRHAPVPRRSELRRSGHG